MLLPTFRWMLLLSGPHCYAITGLSGSGRVKSGAVAKKLNGLRGKIDLGMKSQSRNWESRRKYEVQ